MNHLPEIIGAMPEHIPHIAENIRHEDRQEFAALSLDPERVLRLSLRSALAAWTGTVDGIPICMFGVSSGELGDGRPWMIGTSDLDRFATLFLRRCRKQVARMLEIRPTLANYVHADNRRAIQWLRWLGFSIEASIPWGPQRQLFHRFELRRLP